MTDPRSSLPGAPASLVDRVKNILITPKTEWPRIAAEPATVQGIYTGYVVILAAIPPIAAAIGLFLFMPRYAGVAAFPMGFLIGSLVLNYLVTLAVVFLMAVIIEALATNFGGAKDRIGALKISAYASTPAWIAGILAIVPTLSPLIYLSYLYVAYLIYLGLGPVLKVPADKSVVFTIVIVIAYVLLVILIGAVVGMILVSMFLSSLATPMMIR
jgi:hypothetical protein